MNFRLRKTRQSNKQSSKQSNKQNGKQSNIQSSKQSSKQSNKQGNKQSNKGSFPKQKWLNTRWELKHAWIGPLNDSIFEDKKCRILKKLKTLGKPKRLQDAKEIKI